MTLIQLGAVSVTRAKPYSPVAYPFVECCTVTRCTGVEKPRSRVAGVDCDPTHYTTTRFGILPASTYSALTIWKGRVLRQK